MSAILTRIQGKQQFHSLCAERAKALAAGDLETFDAMGAEIDDLLDRLPVQRHAVE